MRSTLFALVALAWAVSSVAAMRDHAHLVKFRRQANPSASKYPPTLQTPPRASLPQDWVAALEALQTAGKIPNIPVSKASKNGVKYPNGYGHKKETCSWSVTNCQGANDIHEGADGVWTISFDDGPTAVSPGLYDFLHSHNQAGTHFMIGSQIVAYMDAAKHALATQQQLAVHTWSHSLQTTKDNYEILGELGWTMQIIYDLSGRVPKYWRPPQGDIDNRVRAIAEGVFNLTAVMWNAECNDWCIGDNGKSACPGETPGLNQKSVRTAIKKALKMDKNPGVMLLEHELNKYTVGFFEQYYPTLQGLGWKALSVPEQFGVNWYHNAVDNDDTPIKVNSMLYSTVQAAVQQANGTAGGTASQKNALKNAGGNSTTGSGSNSTTSSAQSNASPATSGATAQARILAATTIGMATMMIFAAACALSL